MSNLTESDFAALQADIQVERLERRRKEDKWRIDRTISPTLIIAIVSGIVSGVMAYSDLKKDVALIQADLATLHSRDDHIESAETATLNMIIAQYRELSSKVDRLVERQPR